MKNIAILAIAGAACLVASCSQQQQQQQTTAPAPAPVVQAKGKEVCSGVLPCNTSKLSN